MSRIFYEVAESALTSISASTYSKVTTATAALVLDGQCSPYKSHQQKEWIPEGHGADGLIRMENTRHVLLVATGRSAASPFSGDCLTGRLPASILYQIFEWPLRKPAWLDYSAAVWAAVPNRFSGYDDEGNPLFALNPEVRFLDKIVIHREPRMDDYGRG